MTNVYNSQTSLNNYSKQKSDGLVNGTAVKLPLKAIMEPCCFADSFFHSTGLMLLISDLLDLSFITDILIAMITISKKWIMLFMFSIFWFWLIELASKGLFYQDYQLVGLK